MERIDRNNIKIKALRRKFGLEGYAVYICILEMLSDEDRIRLQFSKTDSELIAADLDIEDSRLSEIVSYCVKLDLLSLDKGVLTSEALCGIIATKEKRSKAGILGMKRRWGNNGEDADPKKKDPADDEGLGKPKTRRFVKPTPAEVQAYCDERHNGISGQAFCDFYESKGWVVGRSPMKDWKGAVRTWENRHKNETAASTTNQSLGVGEYITPDGRRTYGDGRYTVPADAPKRPSAQDIWDSANKRWIVI